MTGERPEGGGSGGDSGGVFDRRGGGGGGWPLNGISKLLLSKHGARMEENLEEMRKRLR